MDKINLTCSCCLGDAPAFKQWHNRDTGYGLCGDCANYIAEKEGEKYVRECYGVEGIHYFKEVI